MVPEDWHRVLTWTAAPEAGSPSLVGRTVEVPIEPFVARMTVEAEVLREHLAGRVMDEVWRRLKQRLQDRLDETGFVVEGDARISMHEDPCTGRVECMLRARLRDDWDSTHSTWASVRAAVEQDQQDRRDPSRWE